MFTLETERLVLRDWKRADWKEVQTYAGDPEVSKYMIWGPNTEAETKEFIETAVDIAASKPRRGYELAMILKESEKVIGGFGLQITGKENATGMVGYVLHRNYWGQGFVTEAAERMMVFGFTQLNLHRIYATCDTENIGSARVMEKCGMRKEAHFIEDLMIKGKWRDTYLYAILDREWRARR
jgi:RimJ/RimL family protein N-acetyltransferase